MKFISVNWFHFNICDSFLLSASLIHCYQNQFVSLIYLWHHHSESCAPCRNKEKSSHWPCSVLCCADVMQWAGSKVCPANFQVHTDHCSSAVYSDRSRQHSRHAGGKSCWGGTINLLQWRDTEHANWKHFEQTLIKAQWNNSSGICFLVGIQKNFCLKY